MQPQSTFVAKTPQLDLVKVRDVLVAFYSEFNPERMSNIDPILEKYCGYEVALLNSLKEKYNVSDYPLIDNLLATIVVVEEPQEPEAEFTAPISPIRSNADQPQSSESTMNSSPEVLSWSRPQEAVTATVTAATPTTTATTAVASFGGLSSISGRFLSGVSWGLNNDSFNTFSAPAPENDPTSATKVFRMQAEIDRLEQEKSSLENTVKKLSALVNTSSESNGETKELELKERLLDTHRRLWAQLESLLDDKNAMTLNHEAYPSNVDVSKRDLLDCKSHEDLKSEILFLRDLVEILRQYAMDTISKNSPNGQFNSPERGQMRDKLAFFCQKVGVDWMNLDKTREQLFAAQVELAKTKGYLQSKEFACQESLNKIDHLKEELKLTKEYVALSNSAREQINDICKERIRNAAQSTEEKHKQLVQTILMEREDCLSNIAEVSSLQKHWQAEVSMEQNREIFQLRNELTKSRRQEAQREREVAFLQRQLQEAANRLARFEESDAHSNNG